MLPKAQFIRRSNRQRANWEFTSKAMAVPNRSVSTSALLHSITSRYCLYWQKVTWWLTWLRSLALLTLSWEMLTDESRRKILRRSKGNIYQISRQALGSDAAALPGPAGRRLH